jgi:hypothetical protein
MSNATTTTGVPSDGGEGEVLPAAELAGTDSGRAWAQQLVDRARSEGVSLTGEDGLLTSMVREVLQAGLDVEMADHLGYELTNRPDETPGIAATAAIRRPSRPASVRWSCGCLGIVRVRLSPWACRSMCGAWRDWARTCSAFMRRG